MYRPRTPKTPKGQPEKAGPYCRKITNHDIPALCIGFPHETLSVFFGSGVDANQIWVSILFTNCFFGRAPITLSISLPFLKKRKVGMPVTPNLRAVSWF